MKTILFVIVFMFISCTIFAADINMKWAVSTGADGYNIEQSTDLGVTWLGIKKVDGGDVLSTTVNVPDDGLVLLRLNAYNNIGTTWRLDAGAWYNGLWKPLEAPSGAGIR